MKKLIYILSAIGMLWATSCTVDDSYDSTYKTEQGRYAYIQVNDLIADALINTDFISKVSLYRDTDENSRHLVKQLYFNDYASIEVDDVKGTITLMLSNTQSQVKTIYKHNGKSIEELGAVWTFESYYIYPDGSELLHIPLNVYTVKNKQNNIWDIKVDFEPQEGSKFNRDSPDEIWLTQKSTYTVLATKPEIGNTDTHYLFDILEGEGKGLENYHPYSFKLKSKKETDLKYPITMNLEVVATPTQTDKIEVVQFNKESISISMFNITEEYESWMWWGWAERYGLWLY